MKTKGKTIIHKLPILLTVLFLAISCSQKIENEAVNPDSEIGKFFSLYKSDPNDAIDYLFQSNKSIQIHTDAINDLKQQLGEKIGNSGIYNGYELITIKRVADSLVIYSYLVKHENVPVRINFVFYKPSGTWKIYDFVFDLDVVDELKKAVEINLLPPCQSLGCAE